MLQVKCGCCCVKLMCSRLPVIAITSPKFPFFVHLTKEEYKITLRHFRKKKMLTVRTVNKPALWVIFEEIIVNLLDKRR